MRTLLAAGAESNDLRALEDLVAHLARVPDDAWEGTRREREHPRPAPARRAPAPPLSGAGRGAGLGRRGVSSA